MVTGAPRPWPGGPWQYRGKGLGSRLVGPVTLPEVLVRVRSSIPGAPALTWYEDEVRALRLDYRGLVGSVAALARRLSRDWEIKRFDRVAVASANCPEAFIAHLAIMSLGAVTVPINNTESRRVFRLIVEQVAPKLILIGRRVSPDLAPADGGIAAAALPSVAALDEGSTDVSRLARQRVDPDDPAVILSTSGTTSAPKGVCLSHYNLLVNAEGLRQTHGLGSNGVHLCVLPLFHANAFGFSMVGSIYAGTHVVLCDGLPGFRTWSIARAERVNILSAVPQLLRVLAERPLPREELPDLRYVVSAAAPLSKETAARFERATGIRIHQGYGLSECVNFSTTIRADVSPASHRRLMGEWRVPSIGAALFGCEVRVRRDAGGWAEPEEEGELVVQGHTVMLGYWGDREATCAAIAGEWLRTGDLGFFVSLDERPQFFVTGRRKEVVIRYGANISPAAVEAELAGLEAAGRFAVVGFPNDAAGEEVGVYVVAPRDPANEAAAVDAVRRCPVHCRPRVIMFGGRGIPSTPTGKVKRGALAARFSPHGGRTFGTDALVVDDRGADRDRTGGDGQA